MAARSVLAAVAWVLAACSSPRDATVGASASATARDARAEVPATATAPSTIAATPPASIITPSAARAPAASSPASPSAPVATAQASAAPRYLPSNPGCAVPAGYPGWSWKRVHRVEGLEERAAILTLDVGAKLANLEKVLDVLRAEAVKTTIFLYTAELERSPRGSEVVLRMTQDGHELANHTLSHKDLTKLDEEGVRAELDAPERFASEIAGGGTTKPFFREPFLATNDEVDEIVRERCYRSIWFTVDTADWLKGATAEGIVKSVFEKRGKPRTIESGSIFIFHGSVEANLEALPQVIGRLRQQGFSFLTLGEALRRAPQQ
jgi:peptidoglycan/xylan/chitin deacetylase (PgdA/CDA1 family)